MLVGGDGQAMPPAGAACLQDVAAIFRPHPQPEAVDAQATAILGLERSLHLQDPF
jgi:hypothetical protein